MLGVNDVVTDGEIAKVGDKGCSLGSFGLGPGGHVGFVGEIVSAEEDQVGIGEADSGRQGRAHDDGYAEIAGHVTGFVDHGFATGPHDAAAKAVRDLVLAQKSGQAFYVALIGGGEYDARLGCHEALQLRDERGDRSVKPKCGAGIEFNFAEGCVFFKHVNGAQLVEIEAHVRTELSLKNFRPHIDVVRGDERADAGPLVALLDLVPPALDLVAHHGRLIDEERATGYQRQKRLLGACDGGEELPTREDADASGTGCFGGHVLIIRRRFSVGVEGHTLLAQAPMHGG